MGTFGVSPVLGIGETPYSYLRFFRDVDTQAYWKCYEPGTTNIDVAPDEAT